MEPMQLEQLQADVRKFARMVVDGHYTGLILVGPGGLGKSYSVLEVFKERGLPPLFYNSHTSPLGLYEFLYHYRNEKAVVLEDMEHSYRSVTIVSLLRSALWGPADKEGKKHRRLT